MTNLFLKTLKVSYFPDEKEKVIYSELTYPANWVLIFLLVPFSINAYFSFKITALFYFNILTTMFLIFVLIYGFIRDYKLIKEDFKKKVINKL